MKWKYNNIHFAIYDFDNSQTFWRKRNMLFNTSSDKKIIIKIEYISKVTGFKTGLSDQNL